MLTTITVYPLNIICLFLLGGSLALGRARSSMVSQLSSSLARFEYDLLSGKFLPFKTPLSSRYDPELPEDARFNIDMIVSYVEAKQLRMGLVVDLTKTDRFYDKQTLLDRSIGYHKLQCEGFVR